MFKVEYPQVTEPKEIEKLSLQMVEQQAKQIERFHQFDKAQQHVIKRMIHASTCAQQILEAITFEKDSVQKIATMLKEGATIICDTNMIKTGISSVYTQKHHNQVLCYVAHEDIKELALTSKNTRSFLAVQKALQETITLDSKAKIILACGNAPTFLYAAVEWLVQNQVNLQNISFLAFPVGYVNVKEAKEYVLKFMRQFHVAGITLQGNYGSSTLVVSALHAIYRWKDES